MRNGRGCRRKGVEAEQALVRLLTAAGFQARRVPLSGSMSSTGFAGDVIVLGLGADGKERVWECKRRRSFRTLEGWLDGAAVVALRADHGEWMALVLLLSDLVGLLGPQHMGCLELSTLTDVQLRQLEDVLRGTTEARSAQAPQAAGTADEARGRVHAAPEPSQDTTIDTGGSRGTGVR